MDEYYKILGLSKDADNDQIEEAYQRLKAKYSKDRFLEGELGNDAARKLSKLEEAYEEIMSARRYNASSFSTLDDVATAIKNGDLQHAQDLLDGMSQKDGEWHYLQSVIYYKKNWMHESKNQLEIAMRMDPNNSKYKDSYQKLVAKMNFNENQFHSGNANYSNNEYQNRQMGGDACLDMCTTWCCFELMCHSCCR